MKTNYGFTLAEVLITLGIIGVVAALTLPQVIVNYEKKATEVRLKKDFATFANALKMAEAEHGSLEEWWEPTKSSTAYQEYFKRMEPYIQFATKPCYSGGYTCANGLGGGKSNGVYFRLNDGTYGMYVGDGDKYQKYPLQYIYLITSNKNVIYGRTYFAFSLANLKNVRLTHNDCGKPECYWSYKPSCSNSSSVWNEYYCGSKFAQDGFTFKTDYNFEKLNTHNTGLEKLLQANVKGWK